MGKDTGVRFWVLGSMRVEQRPVDGRLRRILLGLLLAGANELVHSDVLIDSLWGGRAEPRALPKLQLHVHKLRRLLGDPERVGFEQGGYRLRVEPGELDAALFESMAAEAEDVGVRDPDRCVEVARAALALWRGMPYDGVDVPVIVDGAARLAERRLDLLEQLYQAELARRRYSVVAGELSGLVAAHPLRERLHALLMVALYRSGRSAEALEAYQRARRAAADELGLEPGPELRELERRVLNGEPDQLSDATR